MAGHVWLTPGQVSGKTGFAVQTLAKWRCRSHRTGPPFSKVGDRIRYREDLVDAWLAERTVPTR